ncbi:MAG: aminoacyl-tRNA hydrolase [Candidatus Saccharibacteria bacterium]|nr:aminoacyl-tRNA hydrolase [Candidatus Saccharibacteria bacterium]
MKLIVGFGNPGAEYNWTRHNTGYLALDFYAKIKGFNWEKTEKNHAIWAKVDDMIFIKPTTYYNDQGNAVQAFKQFYKINLKDILVVCDDFTMDFGKLRLRSGGQDGGNNGLKSVTQILDAEDFARLKIGTGNSVERQKLGDVKFVLGKYTPEEKEKLPEILREVSIRIDEFISK